MPKKERKYFYKKRIIYNRKLRPKCFYNEIQTSLTNRGHLIPCCNVDQVLKH